MPRGQAKPLRRSGKCQESQGKEIPALKGGERASPPFGKLASHVRVPIDINVYAFRPIGGPCGTYYRWPRSATKRSSFLVLRT